ncbi:MAG: YaiO family outer membrane beta-barrel protein [Ignavibacteria bacterium]|nr:YaiO family outer membrane beta-barrel protein [Ignavibacteria bacterium]
MRKIIILIFILAPIFNVISQTKYQNKATLNYELNAFDRDFTPWHQVYLEYSRKFQPVSIIIRTNYAHRFDKDAIQFEADAYPKIVKGTYAYLNLGYSPSDIFPKFRAGAEIFQSLPHSFEASAGIRYLKFDSSEPFLITGSVGKYAGNYLFTVRPFFNTKKERVFSSIQFSVRRYFPDPDSYIAVLFGLGFSDEEKGLFTDVEDTKALYSQKGEISLNYKIFERFIVKTSLSYEHLEFAPDKYRNKFGAEAGLSYLF